MYKLINSNKSDIFLACSHVLAHYDIKYTAATLAKSLESHAYFPSLLSMKDTLERYGVLSAAIRKKEYHYSDFEVPFVCSIQENTWPSPNFTIVRFANETKIEYLDPQTNRYIERSYQEFDKIDKDIILLIDGEDKKDEVNYAENKRIERTENIVQFLPILIVLLAIACSFTYLALNYSLSGSWTAFLFLSTSLVGLISSVLLLWHDVDAHNPFLKEVCGGHGRKLNCDAVLNSNGATFFGIKWSLWGGAYFATMFVSHILFPSQLVYTMLWTIISLAVTPYIIYSIFYQWKIVKQWCPLCLSVQAVLFLNAIISTIALYTGAKIVLDWFTVATVIIVGSAFLTAGYYLVKIAKGSKESSDYEKKWKRLRYNPDVFNHLLSQTAPIISSHEQLGIIIGNPDAKNEIVKVCNPYCSPCSRAHPELENILMQNEDVKVRIIFTATGEDGDIRNNPVAHFLAIDENYDKNVMREALNHWYSAKIKDYDAFAGKFPMNGELQQQSSKIRAMDEWCVKMKVRATPTYYVNGHELPESYRINELRNIF